MKAINRRLLDEIKPHWGSILFTLILVFLGAGFQAITPWPFKILIDNVLGPNTINDGTFLGKLLAVFGTKEMLGLFAVAVYFISSVFSNLTDYLASLRTKLLSKDIVQSFSEKVF